MLGHTTNVHVELITVFKFKSQKNMNEAGHSSFPDPIQHGLRGSAKSMKVAKMKNQLNIGIKYCCAGLDILLQQIMECLQSFVISPQLHQGNSGPTIHLATQSDPVF